MTKHFNDFTDRLSVFIRLFNDIHQYKITRLCLAYMFLRHNNVLVQAFVIRHYKCNMTFFKKSTNHLVVYAFQYLDECPLFSPSFIYP